MSVVEELSGDGSRIVTSWKRTTVADGDWLQHNTIGPLNERDVFLAEKIDELSGNADDKLNEEIEARKNADTFLSGTIDTFSGNYETFKSNVEASASTLNTKIDNEITRATNKEGELNAKITQTNTRIDNLEAATDVIAVFGTYDEFTAASASTWQQSVTDNDFIKVIRDDNYQPNQNDPDYNTTDDDVYQVYYEYHKTNHDGWIGWSAIGSLDPYYSVSEIDDKETELSATIASNYLSANGTDISAGKNLDVVIQSNNPRVAFKTKDNVTFDGVSSTTLSATTAYGSSAKFENISATSLTALTATGTSAKFTDFSGTNIHGGTKTATIDALIISAQNGQDAYDKVSTAYWSAYKDSTHSGSGKLSDNFSISAGENLDMEISDNIIKLNGKPAGVIHDDNLSGLGVQGDLLGLNSAINIYVPFIANQNRNSAIVEMGNTPVPHNMGDYNEGFAVYRKQTFTVTEGSKTVDLGTTINFTGMTVTHSADGIGGFNDCSTYGEVFNLRYNCGDHYVKHLWVNDDGLNFTDNGNTNYSAKLNFVNLEFYDKQNNIPGTTTKYESQYVNASSIYKWNNTSDIVTTQSATLSAGFGIQFTSAATTAMGIKLDATINADNKIASIGGKELVGGNNVKIVGLMSGTSIDQYEYSGNITSISAFRTNGELELETQGIVYSFKDDGNNDHSFYSIFVPSADSIGGVQYLATSGDGQSRDYYWENISIPSNYVQSSPANLTIVVGSTGTNLNTLYIY